MGLYRRDQPWIELKLCLVVVVCPTGLYVSLSAALPDESSRCQGVGDGYAGVPQMPSGAPGQGRLLQELRARDGTDAYVGSAATEEDVYLPVRARSPNSGVGMANVN
jgi:hypothetical protein